MTPDPIPFAAAVLTGGRSVRMGADKAWLPIGDPPQPLLVRQLGLLAGLRPTRLLISARHGQTLPQWPEELGVHRIDDDGTQGPLGGIVACLSAISEPRLLIVAVDLPCLDLVALHGLLAVGSSGVVARVDDHLEPLAAVYPRAWVPVAAQALREGRLSLQQLLLHPDSAPHFAVVRTTHNVPFLNWNRPDDLLA
jgi:molybdenum cofactor guanylyltransferase